MIIITGNQCTEEELIGGYVGVQFDSFVGNSSELISEDPCCPVCSTPFIVADLYEGDEFIPYSLNMPDGTQVTYNGDMAETFKSKGLIGLTTPLVLGEEVSIVVSSLDCNAVSCKVIVKEKIDDCTCPTYTPCTIRVLDLEYIVNGLFARISKLQVSSISSLKYKLDNGEWYSNWRKINDFNIGESHTLYIKMANNPSCKISLPLEVIEEIITI